MSSSVEVVKIEDFNTPEHPTWCPGCGDYAILKALKMALVELNIPHHEAMIVSGIGCSSKIVHWIEIYGAHTIHGRALPIAQGAHIANHEMPLIVAGGDGDIYGIGAGHFFHAPRRNMNITLLVHNNQVYGLTKGQASPTSERGFVTKTQPFGVIEEPINGVPHAILNGATFVARGTAANLPHLKELIKKAILHKGFSYIDILQHCVTFNKVNTAKWVKQHAVYIGKDIEHDPTDKEAAIKLASDMKERIALGVLYEVEAPTFSDLNPQMKDKPLVEKDIENVDISKLIEKYIP